MSEKQNTSEASVTRFELKANNAVWELIIGKIFRGEQGDKGDKGENGEKGEAGYTPVKGVDYWTPEEAAAIEEAKQAANDAAVKADKAATDATTKVEKAVEDIQVNWNSKQNTLSADNPVQTEQIADKAVTRAKLSADVATAIGKIPQLEEGVSVNNTSIENLGADVQELRENMQQVSFPSIETPENEGDAIANWTAETFKSLIATYNKHQPIFVLIDGAPYNLDYIESNDDDFVASFDRTYTQGESSDLTAVCGTFKVRFITSTNSVVYNGQTSGSVQIQKRLAVDDTLTINNGTEDTAEASLGVKNGGITLKKLGTDVTNRFVQYLPFINDFDEVVGSDVGWKKEDMQRAAMIYDSGRVGVSVYEAGGNHPMILTSASDDLEDIGSCSATLEYHSVSTGGQIESVYMRLEYKESTNKTTVTQFEHLTRSVPRTFVVDDTLNYVQGESDADDTLGIANGGISENKIADGAITKEKLATVLSVEIDKIPSLEKQIGDIDTALTTIMGE